MSEDLIEITCVKCGRTILVHDRLDTCPVTECGTRLAWYEDDALDIVLDDLVMQMKEIIDKMRRAGDRIYKRTRE